MKNDIQEKARYAFVMGASNNYLEAIVALFNSMYEHNNYADIHFINWNIDPEFFKDYSEIIKGRFNINLYNSTSKVQGIGTAIERYALAYRVADCYEAICVLDADMFFTNDVTLFFEIASKGFIVTGSNGMMVDFDKAYQEYYNCYLGADNIPYPKIHTSVPIFVSEENTKWFIELWESIRKDHFDDFLYLNMLGIKNDLTRKMLCLPPYYFTGIHHWIWKPETSIRVKGGSIVAGTEELVYSIHGKFWDEPWKRDQMETMRKYLIDNDMGNKCNSFVNNSMDLMVSEFSRLRDLTGDFYIKYLEK
jgi:hypothetical protein